MTEEPIAETTARWARSLSLDDVPSDVLERMKLHVLDQIGAQLACSGRPVGLAARRYAQAYARSASSTIVGTSVRTDAEAAAFVNATVGHSFEIDDYAQGAFAHPGCVIVPGVLAIGEELGSTGEQALTAIAAGFEHVIRLGLASMPSMLLDRGFHETCAHGVFGVALTTCMLTGDGVETTVQALAIAGSHASGTTEYAHSGGEVKRVHAGLGAAGGIRAARLAEQGITGPPTIYEGRRGFLQAFCETWDPAPLSDRLGEHWFFPECAAIKPHACVGSIHANYAALDMIRAEHDFAPQDVESIVLGVDRLAYGHAGSIGPRPWDMVSAQFSAHFGIGLRIVKGANDFGTYLDAEASGFADPRVLAISDRVTLVEDDECNAEWPRRWLGRTTVTLKSGESYSDTAFGLGTPSNPISREDVHAKFIDLASRVVSVSRARFIADRVMGLEGVKNVSELIQALSIDK